MTSRDIPGDPAPPNALTKISPRLACAILLAIHALLLIWTSAENSATFDEPMHLAAGAAYWKWGDFTIYCLSPPLLRLWAAAPAVLAGANVPDPTPTHQYGMARHMVYVDDFVYANLPRFESLLFLCRLWMIPISCVTALLIYRWARELYNSAAALAACALYCFNPSILAHGALVTTDLGTTTAMLWAAWLWWRFCRNPSFVRWLWVCVAVLLAHLCKFTAILMWPMMLAMAVPYAMRGGKRWRTYLLAWAAAIPMCVLLANAVYGFSDSFMPLGSFDFLSQLMEHVQHSMPAGFRVPLPAVIIEGFDAQKYDTGRGYPAFLFGQIYEGARWYYYPLALLCKTPVGLLLLMLAACVTLLIPRPNLAPDDFAAPWSMALAGIVYLAGVLIIGDVNIGTRYILPVLPFALILTSRLWAILPNAPALYTRARDGLLLMAVIEPLFVAPWFISYMNFPSGGPSQGWRLLSNSDFDWGNGLIALRGWLNDHGNPPISFFYFGYIDPAAYGIKYVPLSVHPTEEPYFVVSTFYLQGLDNRVVIAKGSRRIVQLPFYAQLAERQPVAVLADTLYIYDRRTVQEALYEFLAARRQSRQ